MNKKLMQKWIMYHEIHKRRREGYRPAQISRDLGLDKRTVRKYLTMSEEEYLDFIHSQKNREKLLEPYEDFIKTRLENCEDVPLIQSGLLSVFHIVYQLNFKIPFYLPIRGFEYPYTLKTKGKNFVDFLSGLLSTCLVMIIILLFYIVL